MLIHEKKDLLDFFRAMDLRRFLQWSQQQWSFNLPTPKLREKHFYAKKEIENIKFQNPSRDSKTSPPLSRPVAK